ncbi:MAG: hypothetical protein PHD09_05030 [Candidatus Omnitrophica bacterium]|nr:hypothetical protein [Candidatus Omnitrophota bacterium]
MSKKIGFFFGIIAVITFIFSNAAYSQDDNIITGPQLDTESSEPVVQWLWGEVLSVDADKNQIKVKFLDFENDAEKEILLTANDLTNFENIKGVVDLKPQDNVSVDYVITTQGDNVAKYIGLEKAENSQDMQALELPGQESAESAALPVTEQEIKSIPGY